MPAPFQRLTIAQFAAVLGAFKFTRRITGVHMHHTWRPNHAQWKGNDSMQSMWRFHTVERGFSDIAQHLTIDPEGQVWTGRAWNTAPASAVGHNGTSAAGPFMFEVVGDFDRGGDAFTGAQKQAVLDVITLVQRRFGLDAEALLFHNQVAAKSCPGNAIDRQALVAEVRAHVPSTAVAARGAGAARSAAVASDDADVVQRTLQLFEAAARSARGVDTGTPMEELDYDPDPPARSRDERATSRGVTAEQLQALRPHLVNLRMGQLSSSGLASTTDADLDLLVHEHLRPAAAQAVAQGRPLRIVLYAHGGLVKESAGLAQAHHQAAWWRDNAVFPIHFVWETGLFETLRGLLQRRPTAPGERGLGDWFSNRLSDPALEALVRTLQGERIWGAMKASAALAHAPGGGSRRMLERLARFCADFASTHGTRGGRLELHAVGHSAGSIFHAHLLHTARSLGLPSFRTLQLLAPAVRADHFLQLTAPLVGPGQGVDALTVFTMRGDVERADQCGQVYRKSLLYLVSASCEPERGAAILGLEDSLRADAGLQQLFGLDRPGNGHAEVVWSASEADQGRSASLATSHGDFDNDTPTMNSVLRRVLGLDDSAPLPRPYADPARARGLTDPWTDSVDWPDAVLEQQRPPAAVAPADAATGPAGAAAPATARPMGEVGGGRRLALCVGIDAYAQQPLAGCRNDALMWQQTLQRMGFTVDTLFDDQAHRAGMVRALERLFGQARAGDELVFQYAGHGTQVDDLDGDEAGGDTPGLDEALCPQDFHTGALLIDDDLGGLIQGLPAGVRLTLFMDCCHSGSNTRFGAPPPRPGQLGDRPRYVRATPELQARHRAWRQQAGPAPVSRAAAGAAAQTLNEVLFTACRSSQVAWESEGHGEFTLRTTRLLAEVGDRVTPRLLHQRVLQAFGDQPRQHPLLDGPPARLDSPLFGA